MQEFEPRWIIYLIELLCSEMLQFVTDTVPVSSSLLDDSLHVGDVSQEQSNVQHALRRRLLGGIQVHVQI